MSKTVNRNSAPTYIETQSLNDEMRGVVVDHIKEHNALTGRRDEDMVIAYRFAYKELLTAFKQQREGIYKK